MSSAYIPREKVERLQRDGLVTSLVTDRPTGSPERTVYEATPRGSEAMLDWVREALAEWQRDYRRFPVENDYLLGSG